MSRCITSVLTLVLGLAAACGSAPAADSHGHGHGGHDERAAVAFTRWTAAHELFAEHPALVVGEGSPVAAHVTRRAGHRPVAAGTVRVELRQADGTTVTGHADGPEPAGIFRPTLTPTAAGPCRLVVRLAPPAAPVGPDVVVAVADEITVEPCLVHARVADVPPEEEAPAGRIAFLKEQAWVTELAIDEVGPQQLTPTLRASGIIRATAGREARVTATAHGRVVLASPPPLLGMEVARNQVLATVVPKLSDGLDRASLGAEARQARAELAAAEAQLARDQRLWDQRAIAERQLDEARTRVEVARARLAGADSRLAQFDAGAAGKGGGRTAFQIRSPLAGTLVAIDVASGQSVEDGELLFTVVDLSRVWVEADIFEPDIARVEGATRASFRIDGHPRPFEIAPPDGTLVTIGRRVDEKTRTVPLIFEVGNPDGALRIGSFATVFVTTGAPRPALAVPETAIVDDAGREVVYVQVEGEAFERRVITPGLRAGGWVEVRAGLAAGDHVVTRGAYAIKLAAAGGAVPGHGHAH